MIRFFTSVLIISFIITSCAQKKGHDYVVTIKTDYGNMVAILYDETPKHKANFINWQKKNTMTAFCFTG